MKVAVISSFLISILHSILFFNQNPGISVVLFVIPIILFMIYWLEKNHKIKNTKVLWLVIPILLLSITYLLYDNQMFSILNFFVIILLFCFMIIGCVKENNKISYWLNKTIALILGSLEFVGDSFADVKAIFKKKENEKNKFLKWKEIGKAIILTVPILLIVILLLSSADDGFASIFEGSLQVIGALFSGEQILALIGRILVMAIVFIYFYCIFANMVKRDSSFHYEYEGENKDGIKLDGLSINMILTVLNVVYLIFSMVQLKAFSTNSYHAIEQYSRSARQGFFQLMIVTFINFVLILISSKNNNQQSVNSKMYRKIMNTFMIFFTFVILMVSFQRMYLYESRYGYTYLRFLVYYTLITECILMIPTILYVWKGKISLLKTYFCIIIVMYVLLNFINLDKVIVTENGKRYLAGEDMDILYLINHTGLDAIPNLKELYEKRDILENNEKTEEDYRRLGNYLYQTKQKLNQEKTTWQEFNIARSQAKKTLETLEIKYRAYEVPQNINSNL